MASKWLTIDPASGGSTGQTTSTGVKATAAAYTGRAARAAVIKATSASGGTATASVTQEALAAFVTLLSGESAKTVLASDSGNSDYHVEVTVQGKSNAPRLSLSSGTKVISGVTATLRVNGSEVAGWDGISSTEVTGDPGADSEYAFVITFSIPENQTEAARTHSVAVAAPDATPQGVAITQQAGTRWYGTPVITAMTKTVKDVPASGGSLDEAVFAVSSISYTQPTGWNGRQTATASAALASGTDAFTSAVSYWQYDTGEDITATLRSLSWESRGTALGARQLLLQLAVRITVNGQMSAIETATGQHRATIMQEANYIHKIEATSDSGSQTYDVPTAGGTFTLPSPDTSGWAYSFTSGAEATEWDDAWDAHYTRSTDSVWFEELPGGSPVTLTDTSKGTISVESKGNTVSKETTHYGYVGCEVTYQLAPTSSATFAIAVSNVAEHIYYIRQAANFVTALAIVSGERYIYSADTAGASGGQMTGRLPEYWIAIKMTFSSGSTVTDIRGDLYADYGLDHGTLSDPTAQYHSKTDDSLVVDTSSENFVAKWPSRGIVTGDRREAKVQFYVPAITWTPDEGYGDKVTAAAVMCWDMVYQNANVATWSAVTVTGDYDSSMDIPAKGGTRATVSTAKAEQTVTYSSGEERRTTIGPGGASSAAWEKLSGSDWVATTDSTGCPALDCSWSDPVVADDLALTLKDRSSVGTLTMTATSSSSGESESKSWAVYQAANSITGYGDITLTDYFTNAQREIYLSYESGAEHAVTSSISMTLTYSSGWTQELTSAATSEFTRTLAKAGTSDLLEVDGYTLSAASANTAVAARLLGGATYTVTHKASGKSASATLTVYQNGAQSAIEVTPASVTIPAAGGSSSVTVTANDTWTATVE